MGKDKSQIAVLDPLDLRTGALIGRQLARRAQRRQIAFPAVPHLRGEPQERAVLVTGLLDSREAGLRGTRRGGGTGLGGGDGRAEQEAQEGGGNDAGAGAVCGWSRGCPSSSRCRRSSRRLPEWVGVSELAS